MRRTVARAFTLVEILIVVVILGILAAIVVPQFASAADDARASNIATQLSTLQNAIELYRARRGVYPDFATNADWDWLTGDDDHDGTFLEVGENEYLKDPPRHPLFAGGLVNPPNETIGASAALGVDGIANTAWVWNSATQRIYATFFNESDGTVDPLVIDDPNTVN